MSQILIAFDQLLNTLIPGGWADETISSRSYRWSRSGTRHWPRKSIDALFFWQTDHCKQAYESELRRWHMPPELRD